MKLLGKANWYLPRWLNWLPRVGLGENEAEAVTVSSLNTKPVNVIANDLGVMRKGYQK